MLSFEEIISSPLEVANSVGGFSVLTFDPDSEVSFSNVDDVPVGLVLGKSVGLVRFDSVPPRFTSLSTMDGFSVSKDEFVRLVNISRNKK